MNPTIATSFEVQVDTEIARLVEERSKVEGAIEGAYAAIKNAKKADEYTLRYFPRVQQLADEAEASLPGLRAQLDQADDALNAEQRKYTGWTRYFLVNNANGHLHRNIYTNNCSSCFPTTQYKWITEASGLTEAELVELAGERCCTVCFPSAPVEKRADRIFRSDDEIAKEARDAERAAKREAKLAKAINADGTELRITATTSRFGETLKTIVATANFYADRLADAERVAKFVNDGGRNDDLIADYRQQAEQALVALAKRSGVEVEAKRAELADKVAKKIKRELAA